MNTSENNHFWESADIEPVEKCPLCGSHASRLRYKNRPDHYEGVREEMRAAWNVKQCLDCRSYYLAERPTREKIAKAYPLSYFTHANAQAAHKADNGASLLWKWANGYLNKHYHANRHPASNWGAWIISALPPLSLQLDYFFRYLDSRQAKSKRILDVGCGNGRFLLRAQQAGWSVAGVEIDQEAVQVAQQAGLSIQEGAFDSLQYKDEFDVVTCSHVIEHVHDPLALLQSMKTYARPGGTIWLATPNAESIGHKLFGAAWVALDPPRHLHVFSRHGLFRLLTQAGFVDIRFHRRGRGSKFVFQQSRRIARQDNLKIISIPIFLADILATLSPGFSEELVVTARKPS